VRVGIAIGRERQAKWDRQSTAERRLQRLGRWSLTPTHSSGVVAGPNSEPTRAISAASSIVTRAPTSHSSPLP
jgi:hypothetical protein